MYFVLSTSNVEGKVMKDYNIHTNYNIHTILNTQNFHLINTALWFDHNPSFPLHYKKFASVPCQNLTTAKQNGISNWCQTNCDSAAIHLAMQIWFRGGNLNGLQEIWAHSVSGGGVCPKLGKYYEISDWDWGRILLQIRPPPPILFLVIFCLKGGQGD